MARLLPAATTEAARIPIPRTPRATHETIGVRRRLAAPILLLVLLGTLDVLLTLAGLHRGGHELNPYARWLLDAGIPALLAARVATLLLASLAFLWLAPSAPRAARACLATACLVFLMVDLFSLLQLVTA